MMWEREFGSSTWTRRFPEIGATGVITRANPHTAKLQFDSGDLIDIGQFAKWTSAAEFVERFAAALVSMANGASAAVAANEEIS